ncbi:hypothetical protein KIN20_003727 [Parelaphostrongylus tenuis]|uniref:NADP-dependent oxidoreductase domain-containing protein n=1 Tax=Parelaphostrongylus tenuis TaxID=148309 RepID=A0AAD5M0N9_PARTN|nr:hypothetical protein KIN20_003727 [Parelaphostrongylus tenuis]
MSSASHKDHRRDDPIAPRKAEKEDITPIEFLKGDGAHWSISVCYRETWKCTGSGSTRPSREQQAFSSLARHEPALVQDLVVLDMAKKHNTTVSMSTMILLSWALSQGVGIIPKLATPERIVENFKVTELKLSEEKIESLHKFNRDQHYIRSYGWRVLCFALLCFLCRNDVFAILYYI